MQKTKLGITVGLLGAAIYLFALVSPIGLVIIAGYVLLFEENLWLKRTAVKAAAILLLFGILTSGVGMLDSLLNIFSYLIGWFGKSITLKLPLNLREILFHVLSLAERGLYIILGLFALTQGTVKIGVIDNLVSKHS